ncbi:MAG TPA: hypothetical protein PLH15_01620 [Spirochaetota bacterium]|nr:hypothetical protein [Spirochaetota bacterium]HQO21751.1 hypothetical protein [Spirochaetota bacterium]HQQ22522.1 hypothetical protein [Spirochaetota bacterium]
MQDKEYTAFGPWVYEIDEEHEIPLVFKKHFEQEDNHSILFKIPINMERRSLKPGMHMYDYVIGAYSDYIYIMERNDDDVISKKVYYTEIAAIENSIDILRGNLVIYLNSELYCIVYNAVSKDIIDKFVEIVRQNMETTQIDLVDCNKNLSDFNLSFGFNNIYSLLSKNNENIRFIAYQPKKRVTYKKRKLFKIMTALILSPELTELMILATSKDLIVVSCGKNINFRNFPVHKRSYLYVPFKSIASINIDNDEIYKNVIQYEIIVGNNSFTLKTSADNSDISKLTHYLT